MLLPRGYLLECLALWLCDRTLEVADSATFVEGRYQDLRLRLSSSREQAGVQCSTLFPQNISPKEECTSVMLLSIVLFTLSSDVSDFGQPFPPFPTESEEVAKTPPEKRSFISNTLGSNMVQHGIPLPPPPGGCLRSFACLPTFFLCTCLRSSASYLTLPTRTTLTTRTNPRHPRAGPSTRTATSSGLGLCEPVWCADYDDA